MAGGKWQGLRTPLRRKKYQPEEVEETKLRRCLSRWDLTAVGLGSSLGVGVYLLVGHVTLNLAGPSVVLSFLIAAIAVLFAGLCYAEFGARIPRSGAAYSYAYFTIGELAAFIVGWNNILEAVLGSAMIARGLSTHIDTMLNMTLSSWFTVVAPIDFIIFKSPFFDLFACFIVLTMGALVASGVKEVAIVNNLLLAGNVVFVLFIIILGAFACDSSNWFIPPENVPPGHGSGGFFPFGVLGTMKGAAVCFFGFVGFESISSAGEEVLEPRRVIPTTILTVLGITFLCYTTVSIVISMMVPYYLENRLSGIVNAFLYVGWDWTIWIIFCGTLFGLYCSLFGTLYPLTRLMYCMSSDGLLVGCLSKVNKRRQSPVIGTLGSTVVIALIAGVADFETLLRMISIPTLLSYTVVAACVVILRYKSEYTPGKPKYFRQLFGIGRSPTLASSRIAHISLLLFICLVLLDSLLVTFGAAEERLVTMAALHVLMLLVLLLITIQPQVKEVIHFRTPLVPLVPCLSIYMNIHLLMIISGDNWVRLGLWTLLGLIIYFITVCFCQRTKTSNLQDNIAISTRNSNASRNGKPPIQIIVESPTPPDTLNRISYCIDDNILQDVQPVNGTTTTVKTDDIILHQAYVENNEEKEAKIIDLLDQVLQAEEDSYGEIVSLKEIKDDDANETENTVQRKSLGEISDAGSEASLGHQVLSKYDVIAEVHREDLPRVNEEDEKSDREDDLDNDEIDDLEQITDFNDCDSRTDESGYSDTIDRNAFSESLEESKEEIPNIPIPPPLPLDDNFFRSPNFKKSHTITSKHRHSARASEPDDQENKPRESIKSTTSTTSLGDGNLAFGSDRQIHFMSKLNNIFQTKITNSDDEEPRKRSHSTGNVTENTEFSINRERSPLFLALKHEITSMEAAQNLNHVNVEEPNMSASTEKQTQSEQNPMEEVEDAGLSMDDFKSKLENIYASGGPKLLKPGLKKPSQPSPEESYQTDTSSTESIQKLPKMDKNDTLKRQKAKFSEVLNSFRISFNKDDVV